MEEIGTRKAAEKWGVSQNTVQNWCRLGLIVGATKDPKSSTWIIPKDAEKAITRRKKLLR